MKLTLSQRIAARVEQKQPNQRAKNRAAFLANKKDIAEALQDRWSMKVIWETLTSEGKISFSYVMFTKYVHQLINKEQKTSAEVAQPTQPAPATNSAPVEQPTTTPKGFNFNPAPDPKRLL
jgi:hypothetical protein